MDVLDDAVVADAEGQEGQGEASVVSPAVVSLPFISAKASATAARHAIRVFDVIGVSS
jgi:hypothetical protein